MPWLSSFLRRRWPAEPDPFSDHLNAVKVIRGRRCVHIPRPNANFTSRRSLTPPGTSRTPEPQSQSPLLSLPVELRSQIWSLIAGPSRDITLGAGLANNVLVRINGGLKPVEGDVRGWETALLCTCNQVYIEVLPVLMRVVRLVGLDPGVIIGLPQLLPRHRLGTIRHVKFYWGLRNPSFVGSPVKDPPRLWPRLCECVKPEKVKDNAQVLRIICGVLAMLDGLESMHWTLHLYGLIGTWKAVETGVLDEINKARQGRKGWKLELWSLGWQRGEIGEQDLEGLAIIRKTP